MNSLAESFPSHFWVLLFATPLLVSCHSWSRPDPQAAVDPEPVLSTQTGSQYLPGTPSWVPLIDQCMAAGGQRNDCIENLPADEKSKFDEWEQNQGRVRRGLLENRRTPE